MAIDQVKRAVVSGAAIVGKPRAMLTVGPRIYRRRPAVALVRSLAMAALAGLGILVVLPAALAAQAASGL